ncbi:hypothetical protein Fmac_015843 [Flemingia macrophylla]|uniref:Uncharacterized protein n=1 Tax=Flemingia macrophylla TaxID=520843 RepID=A0ABD1MFQ2_9FABA
MTMIELLVGDLLVAVQISVQVETPRDTFCCASQTSPPQYFTKHRSHGFISS